MDCKLGARLSLPAGQRRLHDDLLTVPSVCLSQECMVGARATRGEDTNRQHALVCMASKRHSMARSQYGAAQYNMLKVTQASCLPASKGPAAGISHRPIHQPACVFLLSYPLHHTHANNHAVMHTMQTFPEAARGTHTCAPHSVIQGTGTLQLARHLAEEPLSPLSDAPLLRTPHVVQLALESLDPDAHGPAQAACIAPFTEPARGKSMDVSLGNREFFHSTACGMCRVYIKNVQVHRCVSALDVSACE